MVNLKFDINTDNIGILTINREKVLNVLSMETMLEFWDFIYDKLPNERINALIITGAGKKAFVAGADIKQMSSMSSEEFSEYCNLAHNVFNTLQSLDIPVVAAINGYALGGGCELSCACDIRIASENAYLGFPEVKLGIFPCWGGTQRASRLIGMGKAKELIFSGEMISALEAYNIGLIEKVVSNDQLMDVVLGLCQTITQNSPSALKYAKRSINQGFEQALPVALRKEIVLGLESFKASDRAEGMNAFLEKRTPNFKDL